MLSIVTPEYIRDEENQEDIDEPISLQIEDALDQYYDIEHACDQLRTMATMFEQDPEIAAHARTLINDKQVYTELCASLGVEEITVENVSNVIENIDALVEKHEDQALINLANAAGLDVDQESGLVLILVAIAFLAFLEQWYMRAVAIEKRLKEAIGDVYHDASNIDPVKFAKLSASILPKTKIKAYYSGLVNSGKMLEKAVVADPSKLDLAPLAKEFVKWGRRLNVETGDIVIMDGWRRVSGPMGDLGFTAEDYCALAKQSLAALQSGMAVATKLKAWGKATKAKIKDAKASADDKAEYKKQKNDIKVKSKALISAAKVFFTATKDVAQLRVEMAERVPMKEM